MGVLPCLDDTIVCGIAEYVSVNSRSSSNGVVYWHSLVLQDCHCAILRVSLCRHATPNESHITVLGDLFTSTEDSPSSAFRMSGFLYIGLTVPGEGPVVGYICVGVLGYQPGAVVRLHFQDLDSKPADRLCDCYVLHRGRRPKSKCRVTRDCDGHLHRTSLDRLLRLLGTRAAAYMKGLPPSVVVRQAATLPSMPPIPQTGITLTTL